MRLIKQLLFVFSGRLAEVFITVRNFLVRDPFPYIKLYSILRF